MNKRRFEDSIKLRTANANGRDIVFIGNDLFSDAIEKNLILMGKNVIKSYDCEEILSGKSILNKYHSDVFVLMAQYRQHKEIYEYLLDKGYRYQIDMAFMGLGGFIKETNLVDPLLTFNRSEQVYDGIKIYGNLGKAKLKIVVLGNSTSDPYTGGIKSWSEILYNKMVAAGNNDVCILNGAMGGYNSTQEFLKFNRDILPIKPDIVLSMSGYNDSLENWFDNYPYIHKYQNRFYEYLLTLDRMAPDSMDMRNLHQVTYGVEDRSNGWDVWINNIKKIHAISEEFGIKYIPFIQPMYFIDNHFVDEDLRNIVSEYYGDSMGQTKEKVTRFCTTAESELEKYPYIKNLLHIFNGEEVFYDICHCNEVGNRIIAESVFEVIKIYL